MEFSKDDSDVEVQSDKSVTSSEPREGPRPNKFQGPKSTWRRLTEDERLVSTSMTQLRDQDLSVHLYNAHAMKKRLYDDASASKLKYWASKDRWRGHMPGEDDESSPSFVPPRVWTAWPLSSDVVPRSGEQIGLGDGAEEWTFRRREHQWPSRELEDMLMTIILRISRDRFAKREWEDPPEKEKEEKEGKLEKSIDMRSEAGSISEVVDRELRGASLGNFQPSAQGDPSKESYGLQDISDEGNPNSPSGNKLHEVGELSNNLSFLQNARLLSSKALTLEFPAVSTDDERSRRLLRPTIRHTLSKFDELLMALHNARQTCLYYASEHTESQSDIEGINAAADDSNYNKISHLASSHVADEPQLEQPTNRPKPGRPPKIAHIPTLSVADAIESVETEKKERRGRKRKFHGLLEGESHEEMLLRIARLQKKAIPFTSAPTRSVFSSPDKSVRGSPQKRGTSAHTREKRSKRLGLRDWSEILGTAALVGFSPNVIDRATQRCATLFGEGMTLITLVENPTSVDEDQVVDYLPGEVPEFNNLRDHSTARSESDEIPTFQQGASRGRKHNKMRSENNMDISLSEAENHTSSGVDITYYCPYAGCRRRKGGFSKRHYLTKHLRGVHKLDKIALDEARENSHNEMEGGVHVDRFMREVRRRPGWRSSDGKPRQRTKRVGHTKTGEPEEELGQIKQLSGSSYDEQSMSSNSFDEVSESD